ncbi:MAG: glycerol-3-phosphate 1-O-acyltransferase [Clostridia bacterium]|jgi:acyl phosphate:glycerol-3-phosphate acyltransferase|nr:glycerol-3-phosphate 1-O-acyltransferase [Clostridia bacterium]NLS85383.1 glycerol-3-phosphate 1-O-acyltransferase PlsY [Oscillospiraceae bacterium]
MLVICIILAAAAGYLLGSCSFAIIVTRLLYKTDIRKSGSGNAGMTNVLRTYGKGAAALTLIGDIGKGMVAVCIGRLIFTLLSANVNPIFGAYIAGIAAVLGHIYPLYFGFKGGKAVSVGGGVALAINPLLFPPLVVVFLVAFLCTKMVSVGSIAAAVSYPIITCIYFCIQGHDVFFATLCSAVIAAIVIWMHRTNIERIKNGTEYKFMQKKK